ncbi:MAG: hypothetical protein IPJ65_43860 [Archangiaceae bacterium]|nr:hypothetical protein [Archangiaceae bacterium]
MKRAALVVVGLLAACDQQWKPASVVESLRVIGVQAEPPEVRPGETARLSALLLDPARAGQKDTVLWLSCEPDPYGAGRGACGDLDQLRDPSALLDEGRLPAGIHLIGIDGQAGYSASASLFDVLDAGDPRRLAGTVGTVMSFAIAADVPFTARQEELQPIFQKVQSKEIASQLTLFRVRVSETPEAARNHNPVVDDLTVNGEKVPAGATALIWPRVDNAIALTAHDFEEFEVTTPNGTEHQTERIVVSWYTSAGRFTQDRISIGSDVKAALTGPGDELNGNDPIPENRRGSLWAVIRDSRGGQSWREYKWFACDATAAVPVIASVAQENGRTVLRGSNLDQILEVVASDALVAGGYRSATDTWEGAGATGELEIRTRGCLILKRSP